jgi:hypothetical protein
MGMEDLRFSGLILVIGLFPLHTLEVQNGGFLGYMEAVDIWKVANTC